LSLLSGLNFVEKRIYEFIKVDSSETMVYIVDRLFKLSSILKIITIEVVITMCLILFAYHRHVKYRLVLAANRDEFYDRPTAPMAYWKDHPAVLAGRDLKSMGTWMGVTRSGRIAAVTNYREPALQRPDAPSRGNLISDYLIGDDTPDAYLRQVTERATKFNGFNLLAGDTKALCYYSNRGGAPIRLEAGIYGLSNRLLNTPWPKVETGKSKLKSLIERQGDISADNILDLLGSTSLFPDDQLPDTGVGIERERMLSPLFITSPDYGTRCSTLVTIDRSNKLKITEITWKSAKSKPMLKATHTFEFTIDQG
jgi:uncharacterized protein with NRDE domain